MRTSPQRVRFGLILLLLFSLAVHAADTRLGLIPLSGKADDLADLLTAELSKLPGVEMVERRELRRIMEEQGLSSMTSANAVKLGKLARADALLLMEPGTSVVQVRLVSPVAGAVLRNTPVTWPATNTTEIATTLAKSLERDLGRLVNLSSNATLVTLAGFKAALKGSAGAGAEERISRMLALRLSAETNLIVLERRSFDALSFDRETAADGPLTGSVMVDGTFDPDGIKPGQLAVRMRVVPVGAAPQTIDLASASSDEPRLVEEMAVKLLAALQRKSEGRWDPKAEAQRLYEEAMWARTWGSVSEMRSAIEAVWALGMQTEQVAVARLRAAVSSIGDMSSGVVGDIDRIERALSLQENMSRQTFGEGAEANPEWLGESVRLSVECLGRLRFYYFNPELRRPHENIIASIRPQVRSLLGSNLAYTGSFDAVTKTWTGKVRVRQVGNSRIGLSTDEPSKALVTLGHWAQDDIAGCRDHWEWVVRQEKFEEILRWIEFPQSTVGDYQGWGPTMEHDAWNFFREENRTAPTPPLLIGWNWDERSKVRNEWKTFCDRMLGTTNVSVAIRTAQLAVRTSNSPDQIRQTLRQVLDGILNQAPERTADGTISDLLGRFDYVVWHVPKSVQKDFRPLPEHALKRLEAAKSLAIPISNRSSDQARKASVDRIVAALRSDKPSMPELMSMHGRLQPTPDESRLILSEISNQFVRINYVPKTNGPRTITPLESYQFFVSGLLNRAAKGPTVASNPPEKGGAAAAPQPIGLAPATDTNILSWAPPPGLLFRATNSPPLVSNIRFITPPRFPDEQGATVAVRVASATLSGRGYLVDCSTDVTWPIAKRAFTNQFGEVVPHWEKRRFAWLLTETGTTVDQRLLDSSDYAFRFNPLIQAHHLVEVGKHLFYRSGDAIRSLSLEDNRDAVEPGMPSLYEPSLASIAGKLAVLSGDTIILRQPNRNESELFAGLRRRPPQSPLDILTGWPVDFSDQITRSGPNSWAFPVGTNLWVHDFSSAKWTTNAPFVPISTNWVHLHRWEVRGEFLMKKLADGREVEALKLTEPNLGRVWNPRKAEKLRQVVGASSILVTFSTAPGIWLLPETVLRPPLPQRPPTR